MFFQYSKLGIKKLFPAYFAMVMTTGILSISAYFFDMFTFSYVLLGINIITYTVLVSLTILRVIFFFPLLQADIRSHQKGPGFFTLVAGTCVFGSQIYLLTGYTMIAIILWGIGIALWGIIMYSFLTAVIIQKDKPHLAEGMNGTWLIAAVATQSVAVLGTLLSPEITSGKELILFFALSMHLLGCMLYMILITLIFYRLIFLRFDVKAFTPAYWINMGAVAITTLAGSTLILHANEFALLEEIRPFLKGFTLFFWVTGTWWIPLLFILMFWRYCVHRDPFTYNPQLWGMAFPLAMYTASTIQLAKALEQLYIAAIAYVFIYIAIAIYFFIFSGFLVHIVKDVYKAQSSFGGKRSAS